jgi:hypothetical protein
MTRALYLPKPGAHIKRSEAQIIGQAKDECQRSLRRDVTPKDFLAFCQDRRQPVHRIWNNKRREFEAGAGLAAADYLLRSICLDTRGLANKGPPRALMIVSGSARGEGVVYDSEDVRRAPNLLLLAEEEFVITLKAAAKSFADLAGISRMKTVAQQVLDEFRAAARTSTASGRRRQ